MYKFQSILAFFWLLYLLLNYQKGPTEVYIEVTSLAQLQFHIRSHFTFRREQILLLFLPWATLSLSEEQTKHGQNLKSVHSYGIV